MKKSSRQSLAIAAGVITIIVLMAGVVALQFLLVRWQLQISTRMPLGEGQNYLKNPTPLFQTLFLIATNLTWLIFFLGGVVAALIARTARKTAAAWVGIFFSFILLISYTLAAVYAYFVMLPMMRGQLNDEQFMGRYERQIMGTLLKSWGKTRRLLGTTTFFTFLGGVVVAQAKKEKNMVD